KKTIPPTISTPTITPRMALEPDESFMVSFSSAKAALPGEHERPANGSAGRSHQSMQPALHVELFVAQIFVDGSHEVSVPVVQLRRDQVARPEVAFHLLAPPRMWHAGIDVGPEPVLGRAGDHPERLRPLGREVEVDDRLDRFEPVLPGNVQPDR